MDSKLTIFVVFAAVAQGSFALVETTISSKLNVIKSAGVETYRLKQVILNGFFETIELLSHEYQAVDREPVKNKQIEALHETYDAIRAGLAPIVWNASALEYNEAVTYTTLEELIAYVHSKIDEIESKNYSISLQEIEGYKQVAISKTIDILNRGIFDLIVTAINTVDFRINNAIETLKHEVIAETVSVFSTIFDALKLIVKNRSGNTQAQNGTHLSEIKNLKERALIAIHDEVSKTFSLFQCIAIALFVDEAEIVPAIWNQIAVAEIGIRNGFEIAFRPISAALVELTKKEDVLHTIETLVEEISYGFRVGLANWIVATSQMQPKILTVEIDQDRVCRNLAAMAVGIVGAIKLSQNTDTSAALAEIGTIKENVTATAVDTYEEISNAILKIAKSTDDDIVVALETSQAILSSVGKSVFDNIFAAIEIVANQSAFHTHAECEHCVSNTLDAIFRLIFAELKYSISGKVDIIRGTYLFTVLKSNGYEHSFSTVYMA